MRFKLGRLPRGHDPRIPHMSALIAGKSLPPPPVSVYWNGQLPLDGLGMMLNDQLGDCTAAGLGHAVQLWTSVATPPEFTIVDSGIELLYEKTGGYVPGDPSTDNGADEQTVLNYAMNTGIPTQDGFHKIAGYVEIDARNIQDVKRGIDEFGLVYIGFNVPNGLPEDPGSTWYVTGSTGFEGGHCVILVGYNKHTVTLISWGAIYYMTWGFFQAYVDEVYAIVDPAWIAASGKDPLGMTLEQLEAQMQYL